MNTALLIDAENVNPAAVAALCEKLSGMAIQTRRAYGNWKRLGNAWEPALQQHSIRPIQQFDFVRGKNAADMALTIDAVELLRTGEYDHFIIVSGDSDFAPLLLHLRESGVLADAAGGCNTSDAVKAVCRMFYDLEALLPSQEEPLDDLEAFFGGEDALDLREPEFSEPEMLSWPEDLFDSLEEMPVDLDLPEVTVSPEEETCAFFAEAEKTLGNEDGWVLLADAANRLKQERPEITPKQFGCHKWSEFLLRDDRFLLFRDERCSARIWYRYRA